MLIQVTMKSSHKITLLSKNFLKLLFPQDLFQQFSQTSTSKVWTLWMVVRSGISTSIRPSINALIWAFPNLISSLMCSSVALPRKLPELIVARQSTTWCNLSTSMEPTTVWTLSNPKSVHTQMSTIATTSLMSRPIVAMLLTYWTSTTKLLGVYKKQAEKRPRMPWWREVWRNGKSNKKSWRLNLNCSPKSKLSGISCSEFDIKRKFQC